jgi:hypothetical protein
MATVALGIHLDRLAVLCVRQSYEINPYVFRMITMAERAGTVAVCDRSTVSVMSAQWTLRTLIYRICRSAQHNVVGQVTPIYPIEKEVATA